MQPTAKCLLAVKLLALAFFTIVADAAAGMPLATNTLVAAARPEGRFYLGGELRFGVGLFNQSPKAVAIGNTNGFFGWLVLTPDRDQAYFSEKIALTPAAACPASLDAGTNLMFQPVEIGQTSGYRYNQGLKMKDGYLVSETGAPPVTDGKLNAILKPGLIRCKWLVCVPQPGETPPLLVQTRMLELPVLAPANNTTATNTSPATGAELLRQFNRDAWSARQAHDEAVKIGAAILPALIPAVAERQRPAHVRLWLATAIADIPDEKAAAALMPLLDDPDSDLRCVIGYHGPKQKNAKLDQAILAAAQTSHNAHFISYALLGYMVFRGEAPEELLKIGLENDDPQVRTAAANALAGMASEHGKKQLQTLLQDKDERVRATARHVLDAMQPTVKTNAVNKAVVK